MDGRFDTFSTGRALSPNSGSTRPNRGEVLDGEGIGFAVRRVITAVGQCIKSAIRFSSY